MRTGSRICGCPRCPTQCPDDARDDWISPQTNLTDEDVIETWSELANWQPAVFQGFSGDEMDKYRKTNFMSAELEAVEGEYDYCQIDSSLLEIINDIRFIDETNEHVCSPLASINFGKNRSLFDGGVVFLHMQHSGSRKTARERRL